MRGRVILLVIDSLGVGFMDDVLSNRVQDIGANTLYHILDKAEEIEIPNLERLGINKLINHPRLKKGSSIGSYGVMRLEHFGADSFWGHQEIMGTKPKRPVIQPFSTFIKDVQKALIDKGYHVERPNSNLEFLLVNGSVVIGDNIETDYGQIYNITASLDKISFEEVVRIGKVVREKVKVSRVIALGGEDTSIEKILNSIEMRNDGLIGVNSPKSGVYNKGYLARHMGFGANSEEQISSILTRNYIPVTLIGKMQDVIVCENANKIPAVDTSLVMKSIIDSIKEDKRGLIAATIQETDLSGHAQDVDLYAEKLMITDKYIAKIIELMNQEDLLLVTADHGNDPTIGHSQHTREKTPLLAYSSKINNGYIGERSTLSDIAATIADYYKVIHPENGQSFLNLIY